jgi:cytochrome P450
VTVRTCSLSKLTLCHKSINALPRYDFIFKTLWYYIPGPLLDLVQYLPTSQYRRYRSYLAFMRNFSQGIIERSIIQGDGKDIMNVLLRANASEDPRGRLSDIEMVDQIAYVKPSQREVVYALTVNSTLLFAGHDTTSNSVGWYFYEIARNPESQARVRAEIAAIRVKKGGEILSATDLDSMAYTLATLKVY